MSTYKIVRFFQHGDKELVDENLTLDEAQAHCNDPETSSRTCKGTAAVERTRERGPWFDGYTEE